MYKPRPWQVGLSNYDFLSVVLKYGVNKFYMSTSYIPIPLSKTDISYLCSLSAEFSLICVRVIVIVE
jgi:hypothetical protein